MAMIVDQQSNVKHFCKICKKGFDSGRALGGHMRAHGIGDDAATLDDDDDAASDWEDKIGGGGGGGASVPPSNKRMYALRTNPNRLKSCKVCENCGKEFSSWKCFFEHGKCTSDDAGDESLISSPGSDADDITGRRGCGWSKRKRSLRAVAKVGNFNPNNPNNNSSFNNEEVDLANCLMLLSNATVDPLVAAEAEESCASASKDEERRNPMNFMAATTTPMSCRVPSSHLDNKAKGVVGNKGLFECKACKKVFNSHQALGGHRASHKKVKGCFAARLDTTVDDGGGLGDDDVITHEDQFFPTKSNSTTLHFDHGSNNNATTTLMASSSKRKSKVHECSICHRVFSSGQALGGHKRCHWITSNAPDTSTLARFQQFQDHMEHISNQVIPKFDDQSESFDLKLDLNLPAPNNPGRRDLSTEILLQSWVGGEGGGSKEKDLNEKDDNTSQSHNYRHHDHHHRSNCREINNDNEEDCKNKNNNSNASTLQNVDDEADSRVKLAKLSELKDMNIGGNASPWLQVGIGSTTDVGTNP